MFNPTDIEILLRSSAGADADPGNFAEALRRCLQEAERRGWEEDYRSPLRTFIRDEGERLAREMAEWKAANGGTTPAAKPPPPPLPPPVTESPHPPGYVETGGIDPIEAQKQEIVDRVEQAIETEFFGDKPKKKSSKK